MITGALNMDCRLVLEEEEGGFCAPIIGTELADGTWEPLDRALLRWRFGALPSSDRGGSVSEDASGMRVLGWVRITIEPISPP